MNPGPRHYGPAGPFGAITNDIRKRRNSVSRGRERGGVVSLTLLCTGVPDGSAGLPLPQNTHLISSASSSAVECAHTGATVACNL